MISSETADNFKYYGKFIIIIIIVFLLLKLVVSLKLYEAILLSLIIAVSILIIENLIYINDIASDPLNNFSSIPFIFLSSFYFFDFSFY